MALVLFRTNRDNGLAVLPQTHHSTTDALALIRLNVRVRRNTTSTQEYVDNIEDREYIEYTESTQITLFQF